MIEYTTANTDEDLLGILALQTINLTNSLTDSEIKNQGFVTVRHSYTQVKKMNDIEQHVIAKEGDKVIAYILAMTKTSSADIPILVPMFEIFDTLSIAGKTISTFNYMVVGQVCVSKDYRGQGIFDHCYSFYKEHFKTKYDFAITEIATSNLRSLNAHKRIGFNELHHYESPDKMEWSIVVWEW